MTLSPEIWERIPKLGWIVRIPAGARVAKCEESFAYTWELDAELLIRIM